MRTKVQAIDDYDPPITKKGLMQFLGLEGIHCCFCRDFSTVVAPLTNPLKTGSKYCFCQNVRGRLRGLRLSSVMLQFWQRFSGINSLSLKWMQVMWVYFYSHMSCVSSKKKFNKHQLNYSVIEKQVYIGNIRCISGNCSISCVPGLSACLGFYRL